MPWQGSHKPNKSNCGRTIWMVILFYRHHFVTYIVCYGENQLDCGHGWSWRERFCCLFSCGGVEQLQAIKLLRKQNCLLVSIVPHADLICIDFPVLFLHIFQMIYCVGGLIMLFFCHHDMDSRPK